MCDKLTELHHALIKAGISSTVLFYDFYDANLVPDLSHMELFDFPVFLQCFDLFENVINSLVVYDVGDQQFHWMIVKSVWKSDQQPQSPNAYSEHLLKVEAEVIATKSAEEMSLILVHAIQAKVFSQKLD